MPVTQRWTADFPLERQEPYSGEPRLFSMKNSLFGHFEENNEKTAGTREWNTLSPRRKQSYALRKGSGPRMGFVEVIGNDSELVLTFDFLVASFIEGIHVVDARFDFRFDQHVQFTRR